MAQYERAWFVSPEGERRYFWHKLGGTWSQGAYELTIFEMKRAQRELYESGDVYHYTSLTAFQNIIENQNLWFSDYAYLNDSSEVRHGVGMANEIFGGVLDGSHADERTLLERILILPADKQPRICVACFSMDRDSLTQWKGYGSHAVGVAFGVTPLRFYFDLGKGVHVRYVPVIYDTEMKQRILGSFASDWSEAHKRDREEGHGHHLKSYKMLSGVFYEIVSVLKDDAFRDEREFRFIYQESPFIEPGMFSPAAKLFRFNGTVLAPYTTAADIFRSQPNPKGAQFPRVTISEVIVGPHPKSGLVAASVREFLASRGYSNVAVHVSKIPFR